MAKAKAGVSTRVWKAKPRRKRPGVHAKTKRSSHSTSPRWAKPSVGQGR